MYVSGWPEQYKDKQLMMSSIAVSYRGGGIKKSGDMKYPGKNSPNVDSWFSSSAEQGTRLGGGWQLASQWQKSDEPNMSGNLKRVLEQAWDVLEQDAGHNLEEVYSSLVSFSAFQCATILWLLHSRVRNHNAECLFQTSQWVYSKVQVN